MKRCTSCAAEILDDDLFCADCGVAAEATASDSSEQSEPTVNAADEEPPEQNSQEAGAPVALSEDDSAEFVPDRSALPASVERFRHCGQCGTQVEDESNRFCVSCGHALPVVQSGTAVGGVESVRMFLTDPNATPTRQSRIVVASVAALVVVLVVGIVALSGGGNDEFDIDRNYENPYNETEYVPEPAPRPAPRPAPQPQAVVVNSLCQYDDFLGYGKVTLTWSDGRQTSGGFC
jgi:hypothetical protein